MTGNSLRNTIIAAVAVVLALAAITFGLRGSSERHVSAVFPRTVSLFEGSDVRIMGIRVGEVDKITPSGTSVRVDMTYDASYDLPVDVKAVIVSPSIIADRFVQLTPAYSGGAVLASGAVVGQERTGVPVELDETFSATGRLMKALGPQGANRNGAVSNLLTVMADTLDGEGERIRRTIHGVADVSETLASSRDDITGTVEHLAGLTGELADYDAEMADLAKELATVTGTLADDREDISQLLTSLADSLGSVETFVRDNRASLTRNVDSLVAVTEALDAEREALRQIVELAPLGFANLNAVYDASTGSVRTRANFAEILRTLDNTICNAIEPHAGEQADAACDVIKQVVGLLPLRDGFSMPSLPAGAVTAGTQEQQAGQIVDTLTGTLGALLGGGAS